MKSNIFLIITLNLFIFHTLSGQLETYTITKAPFSNDGYDEFSPVWYKGQIVFCANKTLGVSNYTTTADMGFIDIFYADSIDGYKKTKRFSKSLQSKLNDGPVSFNTTFDTVYFSRNLIIDGNVDKLSSTQNKLGIFYAVLQNGQWKNITEFRFNNEWYHVTTPCLSADGKRIYFASDRVDGYGGSDLWYCNWKDGYWDAPVNLGPIINTAGNEAYPFVSPSGDLYFSSDGHPGLGGKDIFLSRFYNNTWMTPVGLDQPINSQYEDFGIVTDRLMNEGYFSSKRGKTLDVYHFKTNFPQVFYSVIQRENQYCFQFNDPFKLDIDSRELIYKWTFGDGQSITGQNAEHCFPGPGDYTVRLDLTDRKTGKRFFNKFSFTLELRAVEQAFIHSPMTAKIGEEIELDGMHSNVPGHTILNFFWDFGDSTRASGNTVRHKFNKEGEYTVNLFLILQNDSTLALDKQSVAKKIGVFGVTADRDRYLAKQAAEHGEFPDVMTSFNTTVKKSYSPEKLILDGAVYALEILNSKEKLNMQGNTFSRLPKKFTIRERYSAKDSTYRYIVDQQMQLMECYRGFEELVTAGFKNVEVKVQILENPAEKELLTLMKTFGTETDLYFDSYERLTTSGYIMLDQVARILSKYPKTKIEIAVHSDLSGTVAACLAQTQQRSQTMADYLINKGISSKQLEVAGYGNTRPITTNATGKNKNLNRRVEFILLN